MKRLLLAMTIVCALVVPTVAQALPTSATAYSNVAKWANLRTIAYWSFPTSTTLKVTSVSVTVTSTHLGYHEVRLFEVLLNKGTSNVYDGWTRETHGFWNFGSVTHTFYPGVVFPRTTLNRAGTRVRYVANANLPVVGCDITTGFYWTGNFLQ